jgi:hypothetical protein
VKYLPIAVVVAGVAAGVWWATQGSRRAPARGARPDGDLGCARATPTPATPGPAARPGAPRPIAVRPPPPSAALPEAAPPAPGPGATAPGFESESRDPAWAVDQERELAARLAAVEELATARGAEVEVTAVECRTSQCRFTAEAPTLAGLSALYGAIETPEGLYGWADLVVLGGVEVDPTTGGATTAVTVVFER